jgi:hypothetical protein
MRQREMPRNLMGGARDARARNTEKSHGRSEGREMPAYIMPEEIQGQ